MAFDVDMPQMGESIFRSTIPSGSRNRGDRIERDEAAVRNPTTRWTRRSRPLSAGCEGHSRSPKGRQCRSRKWSP